MIRIALRLQVIGPIVMTAWAVLLGLAQAAAYSTGAGTTQAQR